MKNKSKIVLRRLAFVNLFDRACNVVLSHVSPLVRYANVEVARYDEVLSYAKDELKSEKETLKKLRGLIRSGEIRESDMMLLLGAASSMQKIRHNKMLNMIERTR